MNRRTTKHLTKIEIAQYVKNAYGFIPRRDELEAHIESCKPCCLKVLESERQKIDLMDRSVERSIPSPECPADEILRAFACGICPRETAQELFLHVASCHYCAQELKEYLAAIEDPPPSFFRRFLAFFERIPGLVFITLLFQQRPAWRWLSIGGLATALFLPVAPLAINAYELMQAQKYIAAYYNDKPSPEMRVTWFPGYPEGKFPTLPGVRYSPENGNYAHALALIMDHKESTDPRWAVARARLEIIESGQQDQNSAIVLLVGAHEKGLNDPATQIDLAMAYYQKGQEGGVANPADLNESLLILTKLLKDPNLSTEYKQVAQFNQAIVSEKLGLLENAISQWNDYLNLDHTSAWREVAQQKLEAVKKKFLRRNHPNTEPPHSF